MLSHSKLVEIVSPALSSLVFYSPQKHCKNAHLAPLATVLSLGEVRGHHVLLDVGFSTGT